MTQKKKTSQHPKKITDMIHFVKGNIIDKKNWYFQKIDTIVNAANPTLMGSNQGVDGAIHNAIDNYLRNKSDSTKSTFNEFICDELKTSTYNDIIRCKRGHAITTSGCGFCNNVIHVVGSKYDGKLNNYGNPQEPHICSSSCIHTLENCYFAIIEEVKKHPEIEELGIPIIGAGEYKFPFKIAVNIAIASIGNALLEWRTQDNEDFEMSALKKVSFFIYHNNPFVLEKNMKTAQETFADYQDYFAQNKRVVFQTSKEAHERYQKELQLYDAQKGYFTLAKGIRNLLMFIQGIYLHIPPMCLKDKLGKRDWAKRRKIVEKCVYFKVFLPVFFFLMLQYIVPQLKPDLNLNSARFFSCIVIFFYLFDTVTYLLSLILLSDVQRPSANLIRSIVMLFVNYVELSLDLAYLAYTCYVFFAPDDKICKNMIYKALAFGFLGEKMIEDLSTFYDYFFIILNSALKFFLFTLVFGYFFNHMEKRKFRSHQSTG